MENIVLREFEEREWLAMKSFYKKDCGSNYIFTNCVFFYRNFFSPLKPDKRCGYRELDDQSGATLLPMDFTPIRHRNRIDTLVAFIDPDDPAYTEIERKNCYFVKGDGDQDRTN